ncbi:MAG: UDP-2,3-diacylglucosamine diphosphatase [Candidatus Kapaibacterium sp.]
MVYFISDIHLGLFGRQRERERETLLIDFLEKISGDATHLIIAGDLFDYWFEYKTVIPRAFVRTLGVLNELQTSGVRIEYVMGNHDFGHWDFFEHDLGIPVHKEDIVREYSGCRFYISHGDGKSYKDTGYKILKKILRSPVSLKLYSWLHPDAGIGLALASSRKSRKHTDQKDYGQRDGMLDFAKSKIEEGFDYVIMGHRHQAVRKQFGKGWYVNLGEWINNPTFARFDGEKIELMRVADFLD